MEYTKERQQGFVNNSARQHAAIRFDYTSSTVYLLSFIYKYSYNTCNGYLLCINVHIHARYIAVYNNYYMHRVA